MSRRSFLPALLLVVGVTLAVACGDEPAEPVPAAAPAAPASAAQAPAAPKSSAETVKIGALFDDTGDLSAYGAGMRRAAELSVAIVNESGGLLGRPVEAVHKDGATSPQVSTDAARALVNIDGVEVIIGPVASGSTLAVAQAVTIPSGVLHISPAATSPAMTNLDDNDFVYRLRVSDTAQGTVLARLAQEFGYETAATIFVNNAYGAGLAAVFKEQFEALGGKVLAAVPTEQEEPTYISELVAAADGGPDVLVAMTYPHSGETILREAIEGSYFDTFLFAAPLRSQLMLDAVGAAHFEGAYGTDASTPESDATAALDALFADRYGSSVGDAENPLLREAFDGFTIAALAIEQAGVYEGAAIRDALRKVANPPGVIVGPGDIPRALELIRDGQDINYEGVTGSMDFDENGDVVTFIEVWQVVDGQIASTGRFELP